MAHELTSPATVRRTSRSRLPFVQGLRAVAIVLVVAFHSGLPVPGGFVGVDVFFVISGFVITAMLLREIESTGTVRWRRFYARRVKRLWPALALMVTVVALASVALSSPFGGQAIVAQTGVGAMLLVANAVIFSLTGGYFDAAAELNPLLHTWSLSVEEQFYLVFPALLVVGALVGAKAWGRGRVGAGLVIAAVGAVSFVVCLAMSFGLWKAPGVGAPERLAFYSSPTRAWEFAAGALVACAIGALARTPAPAARVLSFGGAAAVVTSAFVISERSVFPGLVALLPVAGTVAVLWGESASSSAVGRALSVEPMVRLGDLSYSWYLWHWPIIVFARIVWPSTGWVALAAAVTSLVPALLAYRHVERPLHESPSITGSRIVALGAMCVVIPVVVCLTLWTGARASWGSAPLSSAVRQVAASHFAGGCDTSVPLGQRGDSCSFHSASSGVPLYLVGDSQAAVLSDAAAGASLALRSPLTVGAMLGCPFVDLRLFDRGTRVAECDAFVTQSLQWLTTAPPGVVILATSDEFAGDPRWGLAPPGGAATTTASEKQALWTDGLRRVVDSLVLGGHQVLLVQPVPHFWQSAESSRAWRVWSPNSCPLFRALRDPGSCGDAVPLPLMAASESGGRGAVEATANGGIAKGSTAVVDFTGALCGDAQCVTNVGNIWLYLDGSHVTAGASAALAPRLTAALAALLSRHPR